MMPCLNNLKGKKVAEKLIEAKQLMGSLVEHER